MKQLVLLSGLLVLASCGTSTPTYEIEYNDCVEEADEMLQSKLNEIEYIDTVIDDGYITKSRYTGRCLEYSQISTACYRREKDVQYIPIDYAEWRRKLRIAKSELTSTEADVTRLKEICVGIRDAEKRILELEQTLNETPTNN